MRCWTTLRAEALVAAALVVGCARPAPPSRSTVSDARPAVRLTADAAIAPGEPNFVRIAAFDCTKREVFPGEAPPKGPIPVNAGIRSWHGGGPNGANWNVQDLRCFVRATTTCTQGKALLTLRVRQQTVAERDAPVSGGAAEFEVVVPEAAWERGYDTAPKAAALKVPFKTAAFRAQVALDCQAPVKANPGSWRFNSVAAEDAFVAGFASGE
jgi:hypothetical protein